jgi:hypothetical protein
LGVELLIQMGGVIVAYFLGGRFVSRTGRDKLLPVIGLSAATLSYAALAWTMQAASAPRRSRRCWW